MRDIISLLIVDDLQATINYYVHKLGFGVQLVSPDPDAPKFAIVKRKDAKIMLETSDAFISNNSPERLQGPRGVGVELHMVVADGVDALHAELVMLDVEIIKPVHTNKFGVRHFSIRDLNGYVLTFKQ